jgi:hypothetical protein
VATGSPWRSGALGVATGAKAHPPPNAVVVVVVVFIVLVIARKLPHSVDVGLGNRRILRPRTAGRARHDLPLSDRGLHRRNGLRIHLPRHDTLLSLRCDAPP